MKPTRLRFLVHSGCCLLLASLASAATRPHYGGVLRVETHSAATDADNPARMLVFENLTVLDEDGKPKGTLATTWESQSNDRRWQFWLRRGVRFHDGSPLTASVVVAALTANACEPAYTGAEAPAICSWLTLRAAGDSLVFEFVNPRPQFAAEVALPRYRIERSRPDALNLGTGPFRWTESRGGVAVLQANDDYWGGRPFIDSIELVQSRSPREQAVDFELGRADVIEVSPEQVRRMANARTVSSQPAELIALTISTSKPVLQDARLRQALAYSIDRAAIHNVVLQKQGEIAGGLLPNWVSGYAFLFPQTRDLPRAQQLAREVGTSTPLTIATAEPDAVLQLIAERVALNAREAGVVVQPANGREKPDLVVRRTSLESSDPTVAFMLMAKQFDGEQPQAPDTPQKMYEAERSLLAQGYAIPLVDVPRVYALSSRVRNWRLMPDGRCRLQDVWLAPGEAAR
jgi:peptide/nickel transport system substrate-binding protein